MKGKVPFIKIQNSEDEKVTAIGNCPPGVRSIS